MCIDAHVSDSAREVLVFAVADVTTRLRINVLLGQPKVHDVDDVRHLLGESTYQAVFWFDITVNDMLPK
jgi:hypothetical protein